MRLTRWIAGTTLAAALALFPAQSRAGVFVNISFAPPAIPVYEQPIAPGPDYIWTPGYWAWDDNVGDYYWVPGTWVVAPQPGYLWTPGYWGYETGYYGWHPGYWGLHIGFYGGVNYGFGYFGRGYEGGYWNNNHFFYNTAYSHVNTTIIHNTYIHNTTIINNNVRTSYVGGNGGLQARPTGGELAAQREQHFQPTSTQQQHVQVARQDRSQFANVNHGAPPAAALAKPATNVTSFHQAAVAGRAGGSYTPQQAQGQQNGRGFAGNAPANRTGAVPQNAAGGFNRGPVQQPSGQQQRPDQSRAEQPQVQQRQQDQYRQQQQDQYRQQQQNQQRQEQFRQQQQRQQDQVRPQPQQRPVEQPRPQVESRPQPQSRPQGESRPAPEPRGGGGSGHDNGHNRR